MDARSQTEKLLDAVIGPPLYYCADCLKGVDVVVTGSEVTVERNCDCTGTILAPRKAIAAGEGGLNFTDRVKQTYWQIAASLTGRCV